jgi:hypothetical protein
MGFLGEIFNSFMFKFQKSYKKKKKKTHDF